MTLRYVNLFCSSLFLYNAIIHTMGAQSDMLMWLMSKANGVERSLEGWARRLLDVDFLLSSTTSNVSCSSQPSFSPLLHRFLITCRCRFPPKHSIACLHIRNISSLFAKRLNLSWQRKVGLELEWTRCTSLTVSSEKLNAWTAHLSVRQTPSPFPRHTYLCSFP